MSDNPVSTERLTVEQLESLDRYLSQFGTATAVQARVAIRELQSARLKLAEVERATEIVEGLRWLIETNDPVGTTLYFCNDGDWCSNPNHAHKFHTREQAEVKLAGMHSPPNFRVAEHEWVRTLSASKGTPDAERASESTNGDSK